MSGKVKVWGNVVTVEWADPIEDPDPEVMAKVNIYRGNENSMHLFLLICEIVTVDVHHKDIHSVL